MKKVLLLLIGVLMIFFVTGCGKNAAPAPTSQPPDSVNKAEKILVVYFSVPETTNSKDINETSKKSVVIIDGEVLGNTQYVAQLIQKHTNADIFRIEPENPYPMNHAAIEQIATREKQNYELPKIAKQIENFDSYTTFFVGYPNWYGDMPRILYSFFTDYDFSGKTIIPFVTSGSSGFANSINEIKHIQTDAKVIENGLSLKRDVVATSEPTIEEWLKSLGF